MNKLNDTEVTIAGTLHTVNRKSDYQHMLVRVRYEDCHQYEQMNLYRVCANGVDYYVLAESPEGAIGQASCNCSLGSADEFMKDAVASKLPLMIRGHGAHKY